MISAQCLTPKIYLLVLNHKSRIFKEAIDHLAVQTTEHLEVLQLVQHVEIIQKKNNLGASWNQSVNFSRNSHRVASGC